ncbi:MAG: archaetidylinositol phosphate synthase [Candidatus Bathyarchaeia archaeon]|jgi:archaetidylinositol phosphate synthase
MLTRLKQKIQSMLATEARIAHRIGLTPNEITVLGAFLAFLSAFVYARWQANPLLLLLATVLLLLSGFCDALDGVVARLFEEATVFGGFLDSLLDRYADAAVYVGIIFAGLCDFYWGLAAIIGSLLVSYSRARAEAAGFKMESIGLAERAERVLILAVASLVAIFWQPTMVMNAAIILLAVLTNLTVLQRSFYVYGKSKKKV